MAKITVGGKEYTVPELNFYAVERAWPFVVKAMESMDPISGASAGISIVVAGLVEDEDFQPLKYGLDADVDRDQAFELLTKKFKRALKATEIPAVRDAVNEIVKEAGLIAESGELTEEENPGTGTAPIILPNSLPQDAAAETGSS